MRLLLDLRVKPATFQHIMPGSSCESELLVSALTTRFRFAASSPQGESKGSDEASRDQSGDATDIVVESTIHISTQILGRSENRMNRTALERRVSENQLWSWRVIDIADESRAATLPLDYLCERTRPLACEQVASVKGLAGFADAQGIVFFVVGLAGHEGGIWERFLNDYLQVVRNMEARDAPRFCICLVGTHDPGHLRSIAGLAVNYFDRYLDDHDVSMLVRPTLGPMWFRFRRRSRLQCPPKLSRPDSQSRSRSRRRHSKLP